MDASPSATGLVELRSEPASGLGHSATIPSARSIASEWRKHPLRRGRIELGLSASKRWNEFRFNSHGELIAKFTDADRAHRDEVRGCDGYFRSEKALGIEQRCVSGMPGAAA